MKRLICGFLFLALVLFDTPPAESQECFDYGNGFPYIIGQESLAGGSLDCLAFDGDKVAAACHMTLNWLTLDAGGLPSLEGSYTAPVKIKGVDVQGDLVFLALGGTGSQVVDFSDPGMPVLAAEIPSLNETTIVVCEGNHLYLAEGSGGLRILDITDPTNPVQVFASGNPLVYQVAATDGHCWEFQSNGIYTCFDVSDPALPLEVYYYDNPDFYSYFAKVEAADGLLRWTRAYYDPEPTIPTIYGFQCFDVTDPANPVNLDAPLPPGNWIYQTGDTSIFCFSQTDEILISGFDDTAGQHQIIPVPGIRNVLGLRNGLIYGGIGDDLVVIDPAQAGPSPLLGSCLINVYSGAVLDWDLSDDIIFFQVYFFDPFTPGMDFNEMYMVDVSDPANPVSMSSDLAWGADPGLDSGVLVYGDYIYWVYGIWNWRTSTAAGTFNCRRGDVLVGDAIYQPGQDGIRVWDLADPVAPVEVGTLFAGQDQKYEPILVEGSVAYTRTIDRQKLKLVTIDLSDPLNPVPLGYLANCGEALDVDDDVLYLKNGTELQLVDVTDPVRPTHAGELEGLTSIEGVAARGRMFYLGLDDRLIRVGDSSSPSAPVLGAGYDLLEPFSRIMVHGHALFTLGNDGLRIWDPDCSDPGPDPVSAVGELPEADDVLGLAQPYPNPFNPMVTVQWYMLRPGPVHLVVYDLAGRKIRTLVQGDLPNGRHQTNWEGIDAAGRSVPSGTYLVGLRQGDKLVTRKVSLIR